MGQEGYSRWYLFLDPDECCNTYFPLSSNCPFETTPQTGYYWETYHEDQRNDAIQSPFYNHTFYPDLAAGTCINGTDYPVSDSASKCAESVRHCHSTKLLHFAGSTFNVGMDDKDRRLQASLHLS